MNTDSIDTRAPELERVSGQVKASISDALTSGRQWMADTAELVMTESRLALASFTAMLSLGLVTAMTLFLSILALLTAVGLALVNAFSLDPVYIALAVAAIGLLVSVALAYMVMKLSRNLSMRASFRQLGISQPSAETPGEATS